MYEIAKLICTMSRVFFYNIFFIIFALFMIFQLLFMLEYIQDSVSRKAINMGLFAACALFLTFIAFPMMIMVSFLITSQDIGVQYDIKYF